VNSSKPQEFGSHVNVRRTALTSKFPNYEYYPSEEPTMNMTVILLGFVISTLYGAIFHFWKGGSLSHLLLLLVLAWVGFWVGHLVGGLIDFSFWKIGILNTGMATAGSAVFLFAGNWLSLVDVQRK
jgi:hypothetical protein